ncbi:response regulator [Halobacillus sp. BBL2006]|uniref:response regulator n=1 Tax=Halobacillus sp. BBL2006 TaxID=1543706 RepID=UPI000544122E|nr:response regulator [Halobacillus sp. BBL2006]KHE71275.1 hypothetical protein LD39_10205 [Halobacillus sp. BBL2006]
MKIIKVLIVDDFAFMRKILTDIINSDYRMEVIATARDGKDPIGKTHKLKPNVVTLDIEMPKMNGLQAFKK